MKPGLKIVGILLVLGLHGCTTGKVALEQKIIPQPPADAKNPLLVWDVAPGQPADLPRNFRTTSDPLKPAGEKTPDVTGLADLHAAGSGVFSAAEFKQALARLGGPVTVFDLRQESHVFVNGAPISWYATNDWANVGRSHDEVIRDEGSRSAGIEPGGKLTLCDVNTIKSPANATPPIDVVVENASTEQAIVEAMQVNYVRLTVTDHVRPTDAEVDRFVEAVRALPADGWVYFHCRAGKGRTTTFLALYDMLSNARRVSVEDIAHRQELLGDDLDVLQPSPSGSWKAPYTDERIAFVRAFYEYARANPRGRPQLWSEWLRSPAARASLPAQ